MHEQLIGYLLHVLEPDEQRALEARLQSEPALRAELERLRASLMPLESAIPVEPPAGLAERACSYVEARRGPKPGQFCSSSRWRVQDMVVAAAIVGLTFLALFPAVSRSRFEAQVRGCRKNLMDLGQALLQYSQQNGDYFPEIPVQGNLAVAGIYAPTLIEAGWIDSKAVVCPASQLIHDAGYRVPTRKQLLDASGEKLVQLQRQAGGSYAYSLGYVVGGKYHRVRNRQRTTFALMADSPDQHVDVSCITVSSHHGCTGQNVLFEDGHVQWLTTCHIGDENDHIFQNHLGVVGAGIGPNDAVVGFSAATPISQAVLRRE